MGLISDALLANKQTKITRLILEKNNLGDGGAQLLARYLSNHSELEVLEIADCHIGEKGMHELLLSVSESAKAGNLFHLNISGNKVGTGETADALCKLIKNATCL